jgi:hypothetical protein
MVTLLEVLSEPFCQFASSTPSLLGKSFRTWQIIRFVKLKIANSWRCSNRFQFLLAVTANLFFFQTRLQFRLQVAFVVLNSDKKMCLL